MLGGTKREDDARPDANVIRPTRRIEEAADGNRSAKGAWAPADREVIHLDGADGHISVNGKIHTTAKA